MKNKPPLALSRLPWNPWPVSIIGFFTIALAGCVTFVVYCSRHPADLVAADYYEQEIRYQSQIDRLQHAKQRARDASVRFDADHQRLVITLPPGHSQGRPSGTIQLYRPSAVDLDRQIDLTPDTQGQQTLDTATLLPGLWKVRVNWVVDKQAYFMDERVVIRPGV